MIDLRADSWEILQFFADHLCIQNSIDDVLRRQGNAVMLWHVHPGDKDLATVTGCLKS